MFSAVRRLSARIHALFGGRALDRDFEQELASHVRMLTDDNIRRGMTPAEARRAALVRTGSSTSLGEQHRAARGLPVVEGVIQDLRFAVRLILKERWSSSAAIVALALGIGANATGFTIVNAAFVRGLPFEESGRLYMLSWQTRAGHRAEVSAPELADWRAQSSTFELAAFADAPMNIGDDRAAPAQVRGTRLSANAFAVLRQQPLLGRAFVPGDDRRGGEPVVILGYNLWKNRYAADPGVLGTTLRVDGQAAAIVGVMPEGMKFPDNTELWTPLVATDALDRRDAHVLSVIGRLRPDADSRQAHTELNAIGGRLLAAYPDSTSDVTGIRVETLTDAFVGGGVRTMFVTVMGAVGFVLLIACTNVGNLLLSRSAARAREIALRMSIGATRWRVVRQLLVESLLLAAIGGAIGLVLAVFSVQAFEAAMQDSEKPYWMIFTVDRTVFAYVAAICGLTAVLFGLAPALHVSKTNGYAVLKEGGRGIAGTRRLRWFSRTMVVVELALTMVLLAGAGLMIRSFMTLYTVDLGVDAERLTTMQLQLPESMYSSAESRQAFFERLESAIAGTPGVEAAAVTTGVPPLDGGERLIEIDGRTNAAGGGPQFVSTVAITPQFFEVVGAPLVRGRNFRSTDGTAGADTVIVNPALVARFFPGEDPIGRRLRFTPRTVTPQRPAGIWRTVVGVSAAIRQGSSRDAYRNAVVYIPFRQETPSAASLVMRSNLPLASVTDAVRREVQAIDPDQPVFAMRTVEQLLAADRWPYRVFGTLFAALAGIALVLSSVGLYAVIAHSVTQRTQEIGVRMAVGAERRQVWWLILRGGVLQLAAGLGLGAAGALGLGAVLDRLLVDMTSADPITLGIVTTVLTLVALAACLLPAHRATRVDPVVALRAD